MGAAQDSHTPQPDSPATAQIEETAYGTREYISPELLRTVKVGETWSLDYTVRCFKYNPADHLVEFDGYGLDGCWRWKHQASGRVFIYTQEQCCRLIYKLVQRPADAMLAARKGGVA